MKKAFITVITILIMYSITGCVFSSKNETSTSKSERPTTNEVVALSDDLKLTGVRKSKENNPTQLYYVYYDNGNLKYDVSIDNNSEMSTYILNHYTYNAYNQQLITQMVTKFDYNDEMESKYGLTDLSDYDYWLCEYDENDNKVYEGNPGGDYADYFYNSNNQLIEERCYGEGKGNSYVVTYEYDDRGNRIREIQKFIDSDDEYITEFQYDEAGKLIKKGNDNYKYDNQGHLISIISDDSETTYTYTSDPKESRKKSRYYKKLFQHR